MKNPFAVQRSKGGSVWMLKDQPFQSLSREIAELAMCCADIDDRDWHLRDKIITRISPLIDGALCYVERKGKRQKNVRK